MIPNKSKKAFMLGEFTMKIIIAVLCISLLLYLLLALYSTFTNKNEKAQAEATLDKLTEKLKLLTDSNNEITLLITEPVGWVFQYYHDGTPTQCNGRPCLCICPSETRITNQLAKCNDKGVCKEVSPEIILTNEPPIIIKTMDILLKKETGGISISVKK
jgi:hypothetical protein